MSIKENLMKSYNLTEEKWNKSYNEQLKYMTEMFPDEKPEIIEQRTMASMRIKLYKDKINEKNKISAILLGFVEAKPFNRFRLSKAKKNLEEKGKDEGFSFNIKEKLMSQTGDYLDNFGNIIDEKNPMKGSLHHVIGMTENDEVFIGAIINEEKDKIIFGKPLELIAIQSKSTKTIFGENYKLIKEINFYTNAKIDSTEVIKLNEKLFEKIKSHIILAEGIKDLTNNNNIYKDVAIQGVILKIEDIGYATEIDIMLDESEYIVKARLPRDITDHMLSFANMYMPVKVIGELGASRDNDDAPFIPIGAKLLWCDEKDFVEQSKVENVPVDNLNRDVLEEW